VRRYVMSKTVHTRLKRKYGEVSCCSCGREINVGDDVVSQYYPTAGKTKLWHEKCYDSMAFDEKKVKEGVKCLR